MERTSKLERVLFKAVRILMLVAALLSLLAAVGLGLNGLIKSNASADEKIKAPTVSFEAYSDQLAREKTAQDSEKAAREKAAKEGSIAAKKPVQPTEPEQFPDQYRDVLNAVEKSIAAYAQKTGQPSPTETLRRNLYLEAAGRFAKYGLVNDFFGKLVQLAKSLESAADAMSALDDADPRKIFWGRFLDYVYDRYESDLAQQVKAINSAKQEAQMTRMLATAEYTKAGVCAGTFFVLTLLLVLLNIEKNTYVSSRILRSAYPDAYTEVAPSARKRPSAALQSGNSGENVS